MKTRIGFISNSSSTSFVISYKNGKKCEHCDSVIEQSEWDAFYENRDRDQCGGLRTRIAAHDESGIVKLMGGLFWDDEKPPKEIFEQLESVVLKMRAAKADGLEVVFVEVDNADLDAFYNSFGSSIIVSEGQIEEMEI